jgi:hypothetical protein
MREDKKMRKSMEEAADREQQRCLITFEYFCHSLAIDRPYGIISRRALAGGEMTMSISFRTSDDDDAAAAAADDDDDDIDEFEFGKVVQRLPLLLLMLLLLCLNIERWQYKFIFYANH